MLQAMFPGLTEEQIVTKIASDVALQTTRMQQMEAAITAAQVAGAAATAAAAAGATGGGGVTGQGGDFH